MVICTVMENDFNASFPLTVFVIEQKVNRKSRLMALITLFLNFYFLHWCIKID